MHVAKWDIKDQDQTVSIFTCPTDGIHTFLRGERQPVMCIINGVTLMFPSMSCTEYKNIGIKLVAAFRPVNIQTFKRWQNALTSDNVNNILENVFGFSRKLGEPINLGK